MDFNGFKVFFGQFNKHNVNKHNIINMLVNLIIKNQHLLALEINKQSDHENAQKKGHLSVPRAFRCISICACLISDFPP